MKPVGILAAVVGCLMFLFGLVRFNSAESQLVRAFGGNDGLGMALLVGGILFSIGGALTALFASSSPSYAPSNSPSNSSNAVPNESRKCPFCAEIIKKEAKVCRYCGKDLPEVETLKNVVHSIAVDETNMTKCPQCTTKLKLDAKELSLNKFWCPDCKSEIKFSLQ